MKYVCNGNGKENIWVTVLVIKTGFLIKNDKIKVRENVIVFVISQDNFFSV